MNQIKMPQRDPTMESPSLLVCTYEFGRNLGPEGICTERFVKALLDRGCQMTVVTSHHAHSTLTHDRLRVFQVPDRPGTIRVAEFLERKFRCYLEPGWVWRWRLRPPTGGKNVDFIYGRACPFSGLLAASKLALKLNKPLGLHFSDPFPSPWDKRDRIYAAKARAVVRLIHQCDFVTFVTKEALNYTERQFNLQLRDKAFMVPHIAPDPRRWPQEPTANTVFLYAGRFYGKRKPDQLLQGFRLFAQENPGAVFQYFGSDFLQVQQVARAMQLDQAVKASPYTQSIQDHYGKASVLVATDANDPDPVFLTTKIIEYLNTNRKVLLVSPPNSPGSKLVARFPETARHVAEEPLAIADAMKRLAQLRPDESEFSQRLNGMAAFSPTVVSTAFLGEIASRLRKGRG